MQPSATQVSLPQGVSEAQALRTIQRYAPELRLHKDEQHFPSDPDRFREQARFRESRPGSDRGWNRSGKSWREGDRHTADDHGALWPEIVGETLKWFPGNSPIDPPKSPNIRPRDDDNNRGRGSTRGLFLQRAQGLSDASSGLRPTGEGNHPSPVLVDIHYDPEQRLIRVLYWFFYDLNFWHFFLTHEGDWEHLSLLFTEKAFLGGLEPEIVYFAQHNTGLPLGFDRLAFTHDRHPIVFVDRHGHPCRPSVTDPQHYPHRWRTWLSEFSFVGRSPWRDFAGAWGEVGETTHTTGPLGPFFKRHGDRVRVRVHDGRLVIPIEEPGRK